MPTVYPVEIPLNFWKNDVNRIFHTFCKTLEVCLLGCMHRFYSYKTEVVLPIYSNLHFQKEFRPWSNWPLNPPELVPSCTVLANILVSVHSFCLSGRIYVRKMSASLHVYFYIIPKVLALVNTAKQINFEGLYSHIESIFRIFLCFKLSSA